MVGGGVLAYTLLGVDYNELTGACAFLVASPSSPLSIFLVSLDAVSSLLLSCLPCDFSCTVGLSLGATMHALS